MEGDSGLPSGFIKLRRGIGDHLDERRITPDEFNIFVNVILLADYRTGVWEGSAGRLAKRLGWTARYCQLLLKSLRAKGYISGHPTNCKTYGIRVEKYFSTANGGSHLGPDCERVFAPRASTANGGSHLSLEAVDSNNDIPPKEVILKNRNKEARSARFIHPKEGVMEAPRGTPKPEYLEFVRLKDEGKIPMESGFAWWVELAEKCKEEIRSGQVERSRP